MSKAEALFDKLAAFGKAPNFIGGGAKTIKQMATKAPQMSLQTMKETSKVLPKPRAAATSAKSSNDFARLNVGK
jgi:hypothetical protein